MSVIQIPNLGPAIALNGTEQFEAVQAGTSVRVTTAQLGAYVASTYPAPGVSSIATSAPITGGTITSTGTIGLATAGITNTYLAAMSAKTIKANITTGSAQPTDATVTSVLDTIGSASGSLLYRGASAWSALAIGGSNYVLTSNGSAPSWQNPSSLISLIVGSTPIASGTNGYILYNNGSVLGNLATTGSGNVVLSTSPTLVTPNLGTPSSLTLTNATGLPLGSGVTGTLPIANGGTGQVTASAAFNALSPITSTGDLIVGNGASSATRLSIGTTGYVLTSNGTTAIWSPASAASNVTIGTTAINSGTSGRILYDNAGVLGELATTGSGNVVLATSPTLVTPNLGTPSAATLTNATGLPLSTGVTGTLGPTNGGTGLAAYTTGDTLYASATNTLSRLSIGSTGQVLTVVGGLPAWGSVSSVAVTSFSAGTTGLTPASPTAGAIVLAGTLATTNGGTGLTSFTSGGAVYATSTSALTTGTLPVASGGTGVTSSSGANSVVLRDANANVTANNFLSGFTSTAASGSTITLTVASTPNYVITGSGGQTIKLPDATTLPNGIVFTFNNNQSSGTIVVQNNSGTTITTVQSGGFETVILLSNSIATGTWDYHPNPPSNASWSTNTLSWAGSYTSGTWNGNAIGAIYGGTAQTSYATGDTLYASASNTLSKLSIGSTGQVLTVVSGAPAWAALPTASSITVGTTTIASGTTGRLLYDNSAVLGETSGWTTNGTALTGGASTTLAIGGATIGTNALAVTGTSSFGGVAAFAASGITLAGTSTGSTTFASANASATNYTLTFPAATDTVAALAATQTLTNKTISISSNTLSGVAPLASPTFTGTVTIPTPFTLGAVSVTSTGTQLNYLSAATGTTGTTSTNVVFSTSPTLVTPTLGVATVTSINGLTISTSTGTLTIANGKTHTVSNSIALAGTDSTTMTFPATSATIARTDAAQTFTGIQTFSTPIAASSVATMTATVGGGVPTPPNNTTTFLRGDGTFATPLSGAGTVTSVSVTTANGVSGTVATATTTPAITLTLGAITPTTVNGNTFTTGTGTLTLGAGKTATISNTLTFTGTDGSSVAFGAGGTVLYSGSVVNQSTTGPTTQNFTSGTAATYTTPAGVKWIKVRMVGGGGGGGAAGTTSATGGTGGASSFNSVTANGGLGGTGGNASADGVGGAGGSGGTGTATIRWSGNGGSAYPSNGGFTSPSGQGGAGLFGGAGAQIGGGVAGAANSGAGGGGAAGLTGAGGTGGGGGGGAGESVEIIISNPSGTYTYTIGAAGAGGIGSYATGAAGGTGFITVEEHYNY